MRVDPADISGIITPFMVIYMLNDTMVKPMPGHPPGPSFDEAYSASES
jgi:hypothetical protein